MQDENRKFAVFSQESIRNYAETLGITDLTSTIKQSLAEDVSYRVRELVSNCTQFLRHTRRTKLTANVLNRAIYWNHSPAIIGSESVSNFKQLTNVNLAFDSNINLKDVFEEDTKLKQGPRASISTIDITCDMERIDLSTENEVESDQDSMEIQLLPNTNQYTKYYTSMVESVLSDNKLVFCEMLADIRTNPRVGPSVPYFMTFLSKASLVSHDLDKLSSMLYIMKGLLLNPSVSVFDYQSNLLSFAMYCVLEPLAASINPLNDHWLLRDCAARIIAQIVYKYSQKTEDLLASVKVATRNILADPSRPLCSLYGALAVIASMDYELVVTILLPMLSKVIVDHIMPITNDQSLTSVHMKEDAHKVLGAVSHCIHVLLYHDKLIDLMLLSQITDLFGDSIYYPIKHISTNCNANHKNTPKKQSYTRFSIFKHPAITPTSSRLPLNVVFESVPPIYMQSIIINFGEQKPVRHKRAAQTNVMQWSNPRSQINVSYRKCSQQPNHFLKCYDLLSLVL